MFECLDKGKSVTKAVDDYSAFTIPFSDYKISAGKSMINFFGDGGFDKIDELSKDLTPEIRE